jgi:hypothetical protein
MLTFAQKQNQPRKPVPSNLARSHTATSGLHHRADRICTCNARLGSKQCNGCCRLMLKNSKPD